MRYACLISVFCFLSSLTCNKPMEEDYEWLNATVSSTSDVNCGYPRLDFSEDSTRIRAISGHMNFLEFVSKNLPEELNVEGKKLKVQVRNLTSDEDFVCRTVGINFPAILILSAKGR